MYKKNSKMIIPLIFITTVYAISLGAYYYIFIELRKTENNISVVKAKYIQEKSKSDEIESIQKNIASISESDSQISSLFISHESVVDFIQMIEVLGRERGLTVTTKSVEAKQTEELDSLGKELLSMSLQFKGTFVDDMQFVDLIQKLPYKVSIQYLNIQFAGTTKEKNIFKNKDETPIVTPAQNDWVGEMEINVVKSKPL